MKLGYNESVNITIGGNKLKIWGDSTHIVYFSINDRAAKRFTQSAFEEEKDNVMRIFKYAEVFLQEDKPQITQESKIHVEV